MFAIPAFGSVSGPCDGEVTIGGITYGPENDSLDDPIVIPADRSGLTAAWSGTTGSPITDHSGHVGIVVGPMTVQIGEWAGANDELETAASGTYAFDGAPGIVRDLTGVYEVSAVHAGSGGSCEGTVMVRMEGNAATTPAGAISIGGTIASLLGLVMAGRRA